MWINRCVHNRPSSFSTLGPGGAFRLKNLIFLSLLFSLIFSPGVSESAETIIVHIILNYEEKRDYFVVLTEDRDFLVRETDLKDIGFRRVEGETSLVEGETHVSLRSMTGVKFKFDESALVLDINASPKLLPKKKVDLMPKRPMDVYSPTDDSAFLNYSIDYGRSWPDELETLGLANQLGIRRWGLLFLTETTYRKTDIDDEFVRLNSSFTYDWREKMNRLVVGDFVAYSGQLGSSLNMAGVNFSNVYVMDPYIIKYPLPGLSGFASIPSEMEVYVRGTRMMTESLSPGEFRLDNISSYEGAGDVEIVMTDIFGKKTRLKKHYYFTRQLLKRGLSEYSYNVGFLRENFGVESNEYGGFAFSIRHHFGVSDSLTLGLRAEGSGDVLGGGPVAVFIPANSGIVELALSGSSEFETGLGGHAGFLRYGYSGGKINASLNLEGFSRNYYTVSEAAVEDVLAAEDEKKRYSVGAGTGYSLMKMGSISANYTMTRNYGDKSVSTIAASYSRNVTPRTSLQVRLVNTETEGSEEGDGSSFEVFAGIRHHFDKGPSLSSDVQVGKDNSKERVQIQKNAPLGEGLGYRASIERTEQEDAPNAYMLNPSVRYNWKYGTYGLRHSGRYPDSGDNQNSLNLSASGGIAFVGGAFGMSRPIRDSFGLVRVGGIQGVPVLVNGHVVGKTNSSGKVFVPELSSYVNTQVSIDSRNIPIDYTIKEVTRNVSPPLRSGSVIDFQVEKFQAVTGFLKARKADKVIPLEYYDFTVIAGEKEIAFPTGTQGEFCVENMPPGRHKVSFEYEGKEYVFLIVVPASEEIFVDLGEIHLKIDVSGSEKGKNTGR
jgi:outer membrane usher protein FimD/PapC